MNRHPKRRPTPESLMTAYRAMSEMTRYSFSLVGDDEQWVRWVEAKRQIAIATSALIERPNDRYHRAWLRMLNG